VIHMTINPIPHVPGAGTVQVRHLEFGGSAVLRTRRISTSSGCDLTNTQNAPTHHLVVAVNPIQSLPRLTYWTVPAATACSSKQALPAGSAQGREAYYSTPIVDNNITTNDPDDAASAVSHHHTNPSPCRSAHCNEVATASSQSVGLFYPGRGSFNTHVVSMSLISKSYQVDRKYSNSKDYILYQGIEYPDLQKLRSPILYRRTRCQENI